MAGESLQTRHPHGPQYVEAAADREELENLQGYLSLKAPAGSAGGCELHLRLAAAVEELDNLHLQPHLGDI